VAVTAGAWRAGQGHAGREQGQDVVNRALAIVVGIVIALAIAGTLLVHWGKLPA
jgi:hypothetical protein